jgi:SAM-dependent methyltransferase
VDCIWTSHFLEHLPSAIDLFQVYDQFWQILRPGGCVIAAVPHGAHDVSWDDPFHHLRFSPNTFVYLCTSTFDKPGHAGYGATEGYTVHDWEFISTVQVPSAKWAHLSDDELAENSEKYRNVIQEIQCVLRKAYQ